MLSRYDSALSGLFELIVIVEQLLQTSSDDEIVRSQWVPGLVSRVDVTAIPIKCLLLQEPVLQEQGSKMMTRSSRPLESFQEIMQEEFYIFVFVFD